MVIFYGKVSLHRLSIYKTIRKITKANIVWISSSVFLNKSFTNMTDLSCIISHCIFFSYILKFGSLKMLEVHTKVRFLTYSSWSCSHKIRNKKTFRIESKTISSLYIKFAGQTFSWSKTAEETHLTHMLILLLGSKFGGWQMRET